MQLLNPKPVLFLAACLLATVPALSSDPLRFVPVVLDDQPGNVVYAVTVADIDGDGRPDVVAVTENAVLWYQAPRWRKRVILEGTTAPDNVCIVAHDVDRNGQIDLVLGAGWPRNGGTLQWLSRQTDLDQPWDVHEIAAEPWLHRISFANVLGTEEPQLVVSPLNASKYSGARLMAFQVPPNPRRSGWPVTILNNELNRMHNHLCVDRELVGFTQVTDAISKRQQITLTASQEGVSAIVPVPREDRVFRRVPLLSGATGEQADQQGAGEVKLGRLADGSHFIATIEPMHGTDAVVYVMGDLLAQQRPARVVLTDQLRGGHALWCADLNGDGQDEVIVGYRELNPKVGILVFQHLPDGSWRQHIVGHEVACEDLVVADLTGDGRADIVAGGRATRNVVLYVNETSQVQEKRNAND